MVTNLDHLNLTVENFAMAAAWYARVFGFRIVEQGTYHGKPWGVLKAGDAMLCIYEHPEREFTGGDALQKRSLHGLNHFALKITDRHAWEETVAREGLNINYGGAINWPKSTSWYVNDPTGYEIEVVLWDQGKPDFSQATIS